MNKSQNEIKTLLEKVCFNLIAAHKLYIYKSKINDLYKTDSESLLRMKAMVDRRIESIDDTENLIKLKEELEKAAEEKDKNNLELNRLIMMSDNPELVPKK